MNSDHVISALVREQNLVAEALLDQLVPRLRRIYPERLNIGLDIQLYPPPVANQPQGDPIPAEQVDAHDAEQAVVEERILDNNTNDDPVDRPHNNDNRPPNVVGPAAAEEVVVPLEPENVLVALDVPVDEAVEEVVLPDRPKPVLVPYDVSLDEEVDTPQDPEPDAMPCDRKPENDKPTAAAIKQVVVPQEPELVTVPCDLNEKNNTPPTNPTEKVVVPQEPEHETISCDTKAITEIEKAPANNDDVVSQLPNQLLINRVANDEIVQPIVLKTTNLDDSLILAVETVLDLNNVTEASAEEQVTRDADKKPQQINDHTHHSSTDSEPVPMEVDDTLSQVSVDKVTHDKDSNTVRDVALELTCSTVPDSGLGRNDEVSVQDRINALDYPDNVISETQLETVVTDPLDPMAYPDNLNQDYEIQYDPAATICGKFRFIGLKNFISLNFLTTI